MQHLDLSHRESFREAILLPLIESGKITLTIPDKPKSSKQKYLTTNAGLEYLWTIKNNKLKR